MSTYLRWRQITPSTPPTARGTSNPVAADPTHGYILGLGGGGCGFSSGNADKWNGSNWTSLGVPAPFSLTPRTDRDGLAICFDVANNKLVSFGGGNTQIGSCSTPLCSAQYRCESDQTVTYDGTTFALLAPAHSPSPRAFAVMGYCAAIGKVVLYGGYNNGNDCLACGTIAGCIQPQSPVPNGFTDTWAWDGTDWTQIVTAHHPDWLDVVAPLGGNLYGWGGPSQSSQASGTLWKFDGTDWSVVTTAHHPSDRYFPAFGFWSALGKIVMHGGEKYPFPTYLNETWSFDGSDFTQETTCNPPTRAYQTFAQDPADGAMLAPGGLNAGSCYPYNTETWKLEMATAPTVTTGAGSGTCSGATVNGTVVVPASTIAGVWFDYGPTTGYGSSVFVGNYIPGTYSFSAPLTGLTPGTTYHFRARAVSDCATFVGADASFVEAACPGASPYLHAYVELGAP